MKKSKLSITLVTSFIAAMALSACSSVKSDKEAIVEFTPYGETKSFKLYTDDIYGKYQGTSAGVSKYYDKILEVLIRYKFKEANFDKGEMKYSEIENWAANQVKEQKEKAKANAKSNGTSYDDEWEAILNSNNVENAKELKQKFIYDKEKEVMKNWYADNNENAEALKNEFIGINANGTSSEKDVKGAFPYHIRHILVKVDEAGDASEKFYKGTVSEAQAKLLYNTVTTLAEGKYNFAETAKMYSEDGSASNGGDVGIMTNAATSGSLGMVNEFQLGLYAYDHLFGKGKAETNATAKATIANGLGFNSVVGAKDDGTDLKASEALPGLVEVPYEAFVNMGKYAEATADKFGNKLGDGNTSLYPRNILWNKYFNLHNVFVIKNAVSGETSFNKADVGDVHHAGDEFLAENLAGSDAYDKDFDAAKKLPRFNSDKYLTDERGNVIVGVRSQYGIHLMVIEKSVYDYAGSNTTSSLATYYSTKIPTDTGYDADSYVGYIESLSSEDYKKRADDVKSKITSFDSTYDYRLFTWLTTDPTEGIHITFTEAAEGLDQKINQYISSQKENNAYKQEEGLQKVWKSYTRMLNVQKANREANPWTIVNPVTGQETGYYTRLVSEQVAKDFFKLYDEKAQLTISEREALYAHFKEGGDYTYYA